VCIHLGGHRLVVEWAHGRGLVEWITQADPSGVRQDAIDELIVHVGLDQDSLGGHAALTGDIVRAEDGGLRGSVDRWVVTHDLRPVAGCLDQRPLHACGSHEGFAGLMRTDEPDAVDTVMGDQGAAHVPPALDNRHGPGGETGVENRLGQRGGA
jgi:hypothetical protein